MRRITTGLIAGTLLASLAASVLADDFDVMIAEGGITVECFTTENLTQIVISGEVTVVSGTDDFALQLMGNKPGEGTFAFLVSGPLVIDNTGPGDYAYSFTIAASTIDQYNSLRVEAVGIPGGATVSPEKSRSFKDECRTVIPEVAVVGLLLITAMATGGFLIWRRSSRVRVAS
jgi:hypothetical protein